MNRSATADALAVTGYAEPSTRRFEPWARELRESCSKRAQRCGNVRRALGVAESTGRLAANKGLCWEEGDQRGSQHGQRRPLKGRTAGEQFTTLPWRRPVCASHRGRLRPALA